MKSKKFPEHQLEEILPLLIGIWRRLHKEPGPADKLQTREFRRVVAAVKALQEGLETGDTLFGKNYFEDNELLGAYLLYQWVVHYQQGLAILGELPREPGRVLDICSGPSPFALAALKHGASEVTATDKNLAVLGMSGQICGRLGYALNVRQWDCHQQISPPIQGQWDLIILGHCLRELFPISDTNSLQKQSDFVLSLLNRLSPHGYLAIIDSSYHEANRCLLQLRDNLVERGISIQAPCVWRGQCPALQTKNSPCYAQREFYKPYLIKEIQRGAGINLSSLKMSYLIFRSPQAQWPQLENKKYYRIISPPVESIQGKRYYLCGVDGKKNLGCGVDPVPAEARAFEYLRRGELITIENAHAQYHSLDIVNETQLKIAAACNKPIPELHNDE